MNDARVQRAGENPHTRTPFQRGCLFVLKRSIHDSANYIINIYFDYGFSLENLPKAIARQQYLTKCNGVEAVNSFGWYLFGMVSASLIILLMDLYDYVRRGRR